MSWRNTAERYGAVAAGFHWLIALIVIGLLALGLYMVRQEPGPAVLPLYFWHKSFGVLVLALVSLRLLWRISGRQPDGLPTHRLWEKVLAGLTHGLLYVALFVLPLSGWVMSSAKGYKVSVFGWFTLPDIVAVNEALGDAAVTVHGLVAYGVIALLALHIAGALKHHVIDRDATLRRMVPGVRLALALAVLAAAGPAAAQEPMVNQWLVDHDESHLTFEWSERGAPYQGEFPEFDALIAFDPDNLPQSEVQVIVKTGSVITKSGDKTGHLRGPDWLESESFPESVFKASNFEKTQLNQYVAHGQLTIRGITLPLSLPFEVLFGTDVAGNKIAKMKSEVILQRLDYGLGRGQWADTDSVANPVSVRVSLVARLKDDGAPALRP